MFNNKKRELSRNWVPGVHEIRPVPGQESLKKGATLDSQDKSQTTIINFSDGCYTYGNQGTLMDDQRERSGPAMLMMEQASNDGASEQEIELR